MQNIQEQAIARYNQNMEYLQQQHPELYKKIVTFELAVEHKQYQQSLSLEYKDDYFDIKDIQTGALLYGQNSTIYSQQLLSSITYKRTGSVFEAQQRFDVEESALEELESIENFSSSLWASAKLIHYNAKFAPKDSSSMKNLYKFIFLGSGLGVHIPLIAKKHKLQVIFIKENSLELFRLSLFVTDYFALKDRHIYFSVAEEFSNLQTSFTNFLNHGYEHNLYIKFLPFIKEFNEEIKNLQSVVLSQDYITYPFQGYIERTFAVIEKIAQNRLFFNISRTYQDTVFSSYPVLALASGPSVQKHIEWIKKNQDRFIIIAVLSVCKYLSMSGVQPDMVVHIDHQEDASLLLLQDIDKEFFNNTLFIYGSSVHKKVLESFDQEKAVCIEQTTALKAGFGFFNLPTIGEYAVILPLIVGAIDVYMLGLDLALDADTMKDHIDHHISSQIFKYNEREESIEFEDSVCYVSGNFRDVVPSKPNYRFSITQFSKALAYYKRSFQALYNLADGARLEYTTPLRCEKLDTSLITKIDKIDLKREIKSFFYKNGSATLRDIDRQKIDKELERSSYILDRCMQMRRIKSKEIENYLYNKLLPFIVDISQKDKTIIDDILHEYFKIVLSFIVDTLNTQNLTQSKKHIAALDTILLDEIEKIVKLYKERFERSIR